MQDEKILKVVKSSQWINLKAYALGSLLVLFCLFSFSLLGLLAAFAPLCWMALKWLETDSSRYLITNQRVIRQEGFFTRRTYDIELYRVVDIKLTEPFLYRYLGLGNLQMVSLQYDSNFVSFDAVPNPHRIREAIRGIAERGENWVYTAPAQYSPLLEMRGQGHFAMLEA